MSRRVVIITSSLVLAAASTGVTVPSLRDIVGARLGQGGLAAGAFVALHVLGGMLAAVVLGRSSRPRGAGVPVRRVAIFGLLTSAALNLTMAGVEGLLPLLGLRFVEGFAHVGAITALMVAGAQGTADRRARRMAWMGALLVLGVGAGIGAGGQVPDDQGHLALAGAALLAAAAALLATLGVTARVVRELASDVPEAAGASTLPAAGASVAPGLLAAGERFAFGVMTVALPLTVTGPAAVRATAATLGVFMLASVIALPAARHLAQRWGVETLRRRAVLLLAAALVGGTAPGVMVTPGLALVWAIVGGAAAGGVYGTGLVLVACQAHPAARMRAMGLFHSAGSAGHALGALAAGTAVSLTGPALPPVALVGLLGAFAVLGSQVAAAAFDRAAVRARRAGRQPT